jgi:hypothetical protein
MRFNKGMAAIPKAFYLSNNFADLYEKFSALNDL